MDKREATIKQVQTELTTTTHNRNNDMFTRWMKRVMLQKKEKVKRNGNGIGHKEKDLYIAYLSRSKKLVICVMGIQQESERRYCKCGGSDCAYIIKTIQVLCKSALKTLKTEPVLEQVFLIITCRFEADFNDK
ncbi:unnamed protein product [Lactuca virosa]|uniref:SWIM-type domain-containing protein n=1 Tax=Lactuca virosa TaxID=75947 RepID=A0AAU9PFQ8_9ASTR|nr:unnamed protein product [Lactuca virosa]